jgi:hypothetical protein
LDDDIIGAAVEIIYEGTPSGLNMKAMSQAAPRGRPSRSSG